MEVVDREREYERVHEREFECECERECEREREREFEFECERVPVSVDEYLVDVRVLSERLKKNSITL